MMVSADTELKSIDRTIQESAAKIAAENQAHVKGKRGRPKKQHHQEAPQISDAPEMGPVGPSPLQPYLIHGLKIPFALAATQYDCPEIELTDEEAGPLATQADALVGDYVPDLSHSPVGKLVVFVGSILILCFGKYMVLQQRVREQAKKEAETQDKEKKGGANNLDTVFPLQSSQ